MLGKRFTKVLFIMIDDFRIPQGGQMRQHLLVQGTDLEYSEHITLRHSRVNLEQILDDKQGQHFANEMERQQFQENVVSCAKLPSFSLSVCSRENAINPA